MSFVSRAFRGRPRDQPERAACPGSVPGPRLSGALGRPDTPHTPLAEWTFSIEGEVDEEKHWSWEELRALPSETLTRDIHCVTKWSKLDTTWEGVSVDTLLEGVETAADYVMAFCDGGYTTNLPLEDLTGGKAWIAFAFDGQPLESRARRPGSPAGAPPVLLEERQVGARSPLDERRLAGLLGDLRLSHVRRPVAGTAVQRRLIWRTAEVVDLVDETPRVRSLVLAVPGWPGHRPVSTSMSA